MSLRASHVNGLGGAHGQDTTAISNNFVHAHFNVIPRHGETSLAHDLQLNRENGQKYITEKANQRNKSIGIERNYVNNEKTNDRFNPTLVSTGPHAIGQECLKAFFEKKNCERILIY